MVSFESETNDPALLKEIEADLAQGYEPGIRTTPALLVGDMLLLGAQSLTVGRSDRPSSASSCSSPTTQLLAW